MKIGSESCESPNDPTMWKVGMAQFTPFNMAAMFQSGKTANIKNILHVPTIIKNLVSISQNHCEMVVPMKNVDPAFQGVG